MSDAEIVTTSSLIDKPEKAEVEAAKQNQPEHRLFQHQVEPSIWFVRRADGILMLEVRKPIAHSKKEQDVRVIASVPVREENLAQGLALISTEPDIKKSFLYFLDGLFGRITERPERVKVVEKTANMKDKIVVDRYHFFKMMQAAIEDRAEHFQQMAGITQLSRMLNTTFAEAKQTYQEGLKYTRERNSNVGGGS